MSRAFYNAPSYEPRMFNQEIHPVAKFPTSLKEILPLRDSYDINVEESVQNLNDRGFADVTLAGTTNNKVILSGDVTEQSPGNIVRKGDRISITQRVNQFANLGSTSVYTVESVEYDSDEDETIITTTENLENNNTGADNDFKLLSQVSEFQRIETWECSFEVRTNATNIEPAFRTQWLYRNGFSYMIRGESQEASTITVNVEGPVILKNINVNDDPKSGLSVMNFTYERRSETIRLTFDDFELE